MLLETPSLSTDLQRGRFDADRRFFLQSAYSAKSADDFRWRVGSYGALDLLKSLHRNDEQGSAAFLHIGPAHLRANDLDSGLHAFVFYANQ